MKVKIAYTVDLDEVPKKVKDIVKEAETLLSSKKSIFQKFNSFLDDDNTQKGIETLESLRSDLIEADYKLMDCRELLVDYQQAISQINTEKYKEQQEVQDEERQ
tara:strand:- start:2029 stop:2340 length:312 start_codon:yes stop_codon:yes gene_type:complete